MLHGITLNKFQQIGMAMAAAIPAIPLLAPLVAACDQTPVLPPNLTIQWFEIC